MRIPSAVNWKVLFALIAGFATVSARALPVDQGAAVVAGTRGHLYGRLHNIVVDLARRVDAVVGPYEDATWL